MPTPLSPLTLGDLEMEVLEHLWHIGAGDVRTVHLALSEGRKHHPNTIQSTLDRLFRKGLLKRKKLCRAFIYTPQFNREELTARLVEETLHRIKGAAPLPMLAAFVDLAAAQDPSVLDELQQFLEDRRSARRSV